MPGSPAGSPSPPLPDHRPPRAAPGGCLRALSFGCGGFTVLALAVVAVVYWNRVTVSVYSLSYQLSSIVERSGADPGVAWEVKRILTDFRDRVRARKMGSAEWDETAKVFAGTASGAVLRVLDVKSAVPRLPELKPEERADAERTLDRLAAGAAEGRITSDDLARLAEAGGPPPPAGERPPRVESQGLLDAEALRRFLPGAQKLLDERGIAEEAFQPAKLPALLRRDLDASLAASKRG